MTAAVILLIAVIPWLAPAMDEPYYIEIFIRIMIWSIAAISLNLILGFGGMVSLGHAAYLGIGAYTMGIMSYYEFYSGWAHLFFGLLFVGVAALIFGAICLRTRGVYFIMITLAFAQMMYYLAVSAEEYGSDDGLPIDGRSEFFIGDWQLDLSHKLTFYFVVFALLLSTLYITHRIIRSRFGQVIRGSKSNEVRMKAVGFPTYRYKLACFVISGIGCGLAGILWANLERFVSPDMMYWTRSGELIFMVILGGMGSLFGPVYGALVFLMLSEVLSELPWIGHHWHVVFGPFLVLVVLFARNGIDGILEQLDRRRGEMAQIIDSKGE